MVAIGVVEIVLEELQRVGRGIVHVAVLVLKDGADGAHHGRIAPDGAESIADLIIEVMRQSPNAFAVPVW